MAEMIVEQGQQLESTTVKIYRTSATIKGGRRFSFGALVVVGDRAGQVGVGYAKAPGVPAAIEKAQKAAKKRMKRVTLLGGTLPHQVECSHGASRVRLIPAAPGTGVIAGGTVRAVLELAGVKDCLTKSLGSSNEKNLCKAALEALTTLRTKQQIAQARGVELGMTDIEKRVEAGARFAPAARQGDAPARGPRNTVKPVRAGRKPRRGRGDEAGAPPAEATSDQAPQESAG